jgi:hypothetical protein
LVWWRFGGFPNNFITIAMGHIKDIKFLSLKVVNFSNLNQLNYDAQRKPIL